MKRIESVSENRRKAMQKKLVSRPKSASVPKKKLRSFRIDLKHATNKQLKDIYKRTVRTYNSHEGERIYRGGVWTTMGKWSEGIKRGSTQSMMAQMRRQILAMRHTYNITLRNSSSKIRRAKYEQVWTDFFDKVMQDAMNAITTRNYNADYKKKLLARWQSVQDVADAMSTTQKEGGGYLIYNTVAHSTAISNIINVTIFASTQEMSDEGYARWVEFVELIKKVSITLAEVLDTLYREIGTDSQFSEEEIL